MCKYNQHIILSQSDEGQVSWCKSCRNYLIVFGSCVLAFSSQEIVNFKSLLSGASDSSYNFEVQGQSHMLLKNSGAPVGMCLTREQAANLYQLVHEAITLNDLYQIVYR